MANKPKYICRGKRTGYDSKKKEWKWTGCGGDLTALFAAVPIDGKEYEVNCPKCGRKRTHQRF